MIKNFDSFQTCLPRDIDIVTLSETFLNASSDYSILKLDGYKLIEYKNRTDQPGGGIALYVKSHIISHRKREYELNNLEAMWHVLVIGNTKLLLCVCYRPPNSGVDFWDKLQDSVTLAQTDDVSNLVLTGDLNSDPRTYDGRKLEQFVSANNLHINVHEPACMTAFSSSILDQVLTSNRHLVTDIHIEPPIAKNDHCTVIASLSLKSKKDPAYTRIIWDYNAADLAGLKKQLRAADWNSCFETNNIDDISKAWTETVLNFARTFIPNKIITVRPTDKPWYNNALRSMKRKVLRYFKRAKLRNTEFHWNVYKTLNNEYHDKIADAKLKHEKSKFSEICNVSRQPKKWWKLVKEVLGFTRETAVPTIKDGTAPSRIA